MARKKKNPFNLPSERRFYDIRRHHKEGYGYLLIEFHDKGLSHRTGWQQNHATPELCETAMRMRKAHLDGKNYLGLSPSKAAVVSLCRGVYK